MREKICLCKTNHTIVTTHMSIRGEEFAWLKSFTRPGISQTLLCGAEGAVCRLFLEDSQIISVLTNCNTVTLGLYGLIGGGGVC